MNEITIRVTARNDVGRGMDGAERDVRERGNRIARELARAGEKAGDGFERGLTSKLTRGGNEGRGFLGRMFDGLMDQAQNAADAVGKSLAQIPVAISGLASSTVATGGVNLLVLALLGLVAAAAAAAAGLIALAPIVYLIGGTFGGATTAAFGLSAVIGTLVVGLGGLGDAWSAYGQKSAGGGRSAADAAHQVRQATLALADAQREALRAQEDVTRARLSEQERLEDLSRSLAGARLDEEGAVLAVQRAELRLREARRGGSRLDVAEAELAYRKSIQTLDEVRDRVGDLASEQDEANRKGVEGSDRVQDALRRQEMAQRQITQAAHALAQAQRGAGGGVDKFAEAMAKLSPNARSFLESLFKIREQFAGIKRETQDRLFAGLDAAVERLATRSFPTLRTILGETATSLNGVAKGVTEALGQRSFLDNVTTAVSGFNRWLDRLGSRTVPQLIDALGTLAAKSVPFFETLGNLISGMLENFSAWIDEADRTGKLDEFMAGAAENLKTIWEIGGLVKDITLEVIEILFPASQRESDSFLGGVIVLLEKVKRWLQDKDNRAKIQGWITDVQNFGDKVATAAQKIIDMIDRFDRWTSKVDGIIARLNGIRLGLSFGGLPGFAHGGITGAASGGARGGLTWVGEQGPELVRLPFGSMVHPAGTSAAMAASGALGGGSSASVVLSFDGGAGNSLEALLIQMIKRYIRVNGGKGDGSVQRALGYN